MLNNTIMFHSKAKDRDLSVFSRQLAVMLDSGMQSVEALRLLARDQRNKSFGKAILAAAEQINEGRSFSEALSIYPQCFSPMFIGMITAGEESGSMVEMLNHLAEYYERQAELKSKVFQALLYPAIVFCIAIAVVLFMILYIVPIFADVLNGLDAEMPLTTRLLIGISNGMAVALPVLLIVILLAITAWLILKNRPAFREKWDRFVLRLPIFGKISYYSDCIRLSEVMQRLTAGGIHLITTLDICEKVVENYYLKRAVTTVNATVCQGNLLSEGFKSAGCFETTFCQMVLVGENTGSLDNVFLKIKTLYTDTLERRVKKTATLLEPVMLVVVGLLVLFMVLSVMTPIYGIYESYLV